VVLKGGKEAFYSNKAIFKVLKDVLKTTKIPFEAVQLIDSVDRQAVTIMLKQYQDIDLIIPRGGEGLIHFVADNSRIPVIKHAKGLCHTYVSNKANLKKALDICMNAKVQRPGVCNAMETLLVHKMIAKKFLPIVCDAMGKANVEIRGDVHTRKIIKGIKVAKSSDWDEEYLDLILSIKVVGSTDEAIDHINKHGSLHSDAIITENKKEADQFFAAVDSACVYLNASTRFTDGYAFGFGAEVGISTDKLHARGPMALEELTTYKYVIRGTGQIRS
jgi:glutamate-5-semialdehyde dehydrogenase